MAILKRVSKRTGKPSYQVLIDQRDPLTGARKRITIGTYRTRREAEAQERAAMTQRDAGTLLDRDTATVRELLDDWLAVKAGEVSPNTLVGYRVACRHLAEAMGHVQVQALRTAAIQRQYDAWRDAGMGTRTIRTCHQRLRQALDMAQRHGIVSSNAATAARPPRDEPKRLDVWSAAEIARFLDTARLDILWPLWSLLALEGLRRGEALGLRWRDVDFERGTATIQQTVTPDLASGGKTTIVPRAKSKASHRTVTLTPDTIAALRDHRKAQAARRLASPVWEDHDLVITTSKGTPVSPAGNVQRSLNAIIAQAGLRPMTVHGLRHGAATLALASGVPLAVVSQRLGHTSIQITADRYARVTSEMQGDAAAKIGAALDRARAGGTG